MSIFKKFRLEKELSQEEMAKKLGIHINAYRNYEIGKRMMPGNVLMKFLRLRAEANDLELADLLEEICESKIQ